MDITIEQATADDFDEILELDGVSFGIDYSDAHIAGLRSNLDLRLFLVAREAGRPVGISGEYPLAMTVPGGAILDLAGITWVSVSPVDRGRGFLRSMMRRHLAGVAERGLPVAGLTASQYGLYGRYGFGVATRRLHSVVHRRLTRFRDPLPAGPRVELASPDRAREAFPGIHRRWAQRTVGALSRDAHQWDMLLGDLPEFRGGASKLYHLLHPDGFASYRVEERSAAGIAENNATVTDLIAVTPQAHRALWDVLLGMDLVATVTTTWLATDDPLPWLLTDGRQVTTTALTDCVWLRPVDVERCLSARTYGVEVDAVIEVVDEQFGSGRYRLTGGPDGAECRRTDDVPAVTMDVAVLGSTYLGGVRLGELARAGLVGVHEQATAARLDLALLVERAPQTGLFF